MVFYLALGFFHFGASHIFNLALDGLYFGTLKILTLYITNQTITNCTQYNISSLLYTTNGLPVCILISLIV
ncbi:hypothetical protein BDB00DRAFT_320123 [Zychaea mexicana]|uniref:uncharacterized protein n=1 Tax=Zychaea mexicana TaxID=64656 RepID=UPI0022FE3C37|nr:uncharacterized protein BDB00DRAFT_320123 [Zychaea mexicana]KAI9466519.1 hypothetical protein BDB00DRAFT_320123 [Zychaea mexicana]